MCGILFSISPTWTPLPSLSALISRRGPDCTRSHSATFGPHTLTFTSSVLSLRGTHTTPQPHVDVSTGSVLCWNGEAWRIGTDALPSDVNDGEKVFQLLLAAGAGTALKAAFESIAGPYALVYFDAVAGRVWFGRDVLGRRSLLRKQGEGLVLASVGDGDGWCEVEAGGLAYWDLVTGEEGWVPFMWSQDAAKEGRREFMNMPFPKLNMALTAPTFEVSELRQVLLDSIATRVTNIPDRGKAVRLAIMFSGGLDCTVIARLVHECLPLHEGVDLLNVAFENQRVIAARNEDAKKKKRNPDESKPDTPTETDAYELCPDRITGRQSLCELRRVCPRDWRFIAVNVPHEELLRHRQAVVELIHPHNTEMDFSIAVAFYFASRGTGILSTTTSTTTTTTTSNTGVYTTPARILLSGLGADELLGGYARHSTAYRFRGTAGLLSELQLDVDRLGKRNLGRDDRVLAHWGREARYPYLEERVVAWCMRAAWEAKRDKVVLRGLATALGMGGVAGEPKRAVQFGSRSARMEKGKGSGTKVLGAGAG